MRSSCSHPTTLMVLADAQLLYLDKPRKACQAEAHLGWRGLHPQLWTSLCVLERCGSPRMLRSLAYLWPRVVLLSRELYLLRKGPKGFPAGKQGDYPGKCGGWVGAVHGTSVFLVEVYSLAFPYALFIGEKIKVDLGSLCWSSLLTLSLFYFMQQTLTFPSLIQNNHSAMLLLAL